MQRNVELLKIGGGPAGLAAAQYGARAGLETVCFEQMAVGGQALMIDFLENYPGFTGEKAGYELMQAMHKQAENFGAEFILDSITGLAHKGDGFFADISSGDLIQAAAVIMATGAGHRTLEVPGENKFAGRGVSYCASCDGPFFKNKKIFVVGGGDAACDEARFLAKLSSDIHLIHRRDAFRAQKAVVERVLHDKAIQVRLNTRIAEIKGTGKVESVVLENTVSGAKHEESAAAVFVFTGIIPQTELITGGTLKEKVRLDGAGFIVTGQDMAISGVRGLFAAGDIRSSPFRQVITASGDGAIAAHSAAGYIESLK
jgi:thioredoxin reductase (NADPH)